MKRTPSSNSESHNSPLRFHSPHRSDAVEFTETPPYRSPEFSPQKPSPHHPPPRSIDNSNSNSNSKSFVAAGEKFTQLSSPLPPPIPPETEKSPSSMVVYDRNLWVREEGPQAATKVVRPGGESGVARRVAKGEGSVRIAELGFRLSEVVVSLVSFSVMAADKTQGWSGDSYDRYKEYRYCLSVNVIAFVYSAFQACDLAYYLAKEKSVVNHHLRCAFDFFMDQVLAYLLMSAASSAATRVDDWQTNWGKDEFTKMATASIVMAFFAFAAFAFSSLISGYRLCTSNDS